MAFVFWLAALTFVPQGTQGTEGAPYYTAASIASSAANVAGFYTPNSFISIYGQNLSYVTKPIGVSDIGAGGILPWSLTGTNVGVLINLIPADVYYVSPNQVNVLIPPSLIPGPAIVELQNDGLYGPPIQIILAPAAPVLFQLDATTVIATHGNGPLVTARLSCAARRNTGAVRNRPGTHRAGGPSQPNPATRGVDYRSGRL